MTNDPDKLDALHSLITDNYGDVVDSLRVVGGSLEYDWQDGVTEQEKQSIEANVDAYIQRVTEQAQAERSSRTFMQTLKQRLAEAETDADILELYQDAQTFASNHPQFERAIETIFRILQIADGDLLSVSLSTNKGKAMYLTAALHAAAIWS